IVVAPHGSTGTIVGGATNVLANDTDPGDTLTAHLISAPTNGHVTLNTNGTFTYFNDDPAPGVDSWMYEACDSYGACTGATVSVTISTSAPTVTCLLPTQVNSVGDTVSIDLSLLFAPPAGQTLTYSATSVPPSLSVVGSLLTGTLQPSDAPPAPPYTYPGVLTASVPGNLSASENVTFQVLPTGEVLLRDGFDGGQVVQPPCQ
ncbi:MAG TPA: Ig-like domain-containing protein, partial [Rhodanobacteraceae bacterium]|nr:Ig-like domain-containing protein [Rhodanobacteraceae bacterium]